MKLFLCFAIVITVGMAVTSVSGQTPPSNAPLVPMSADDAHTRHFVPTSVPGDPAKAAARRLLYKPARDLCEQAKTEIEAGNLDAAEKLCQKALAAAPVINGIKKTVPEIDRQLGSIYLARGQNKEALAKFLACAHFEVGGVYDDNDLPLDTALAAVRAKDYKELQKHYSDQDIMKYNLAYEPIQTQDLPGTSTPQTLEASVLFAHGLNYYFESQHGKALKDFEAAAELVPNNVLIDGYVAETLYEQTRYAEAIPWLEKVVASPRGFIFHDVKGDLHDARIYIQQQQRANQPPGAKPPPAQQPSAAPPHWSFGGRRLPGPAPVAPQAPVAAAAPAP